MDSVRKSRAERRRARVGAVLMEVLVALTVLAFAGVGAVSLASQSARAIADARRADVDARAAAAFLEKVSLWPREDLDRHLGVTAQGAWRLRTARPSSVLYRVTLTDSLGRELLHTTLYRPDDAHVAL